MPVAGILFVLMKIYIFGNGNISFGDFKQYYELPVNDALKQDQSAVFLICDFRGTDVLAAELLKSKTPNVILLHVGEKPRYFPDKFKTESGNWALSGGFKNDAERDRAAIDQCSHFIAMDFNSDTKRKSGTLKNIELCISLGKIRLGV